MHRIRFDIFGGGGVSDTGHESGSGARTTGIVEVKPGQTVRVIAGGGSGDARTPYPFGLKTGGPDEAVVATATAATHPDSPCLPKWWLK